jgi:hypothetical protein
MPRRRALLLTLAAVLVVVVFLVRRRQSGRLSPGVSLGERSVAHVDVAREPPSPAGSRSRLPPPRFSAGPSKWTNKKTWWYFNEWGWGKEGRDEPWATAMEAALRKRFAPALLAELGLERVELVELTCRATMCRVRYRYPDALLDRVAAYGLPPGESPLVFVYERLGPMAQMSNKIGKDETSLVGDEKYTSTSLLLGYTDELADPARLEGWSRERVPGAQQTLQRMREIWQARQAASTQRRDGG